MGAYRGAPEASVRHWKLTESHWELPVRPCKLISAMEAYREAPEASGVTLGASGGPRKLTGSQRELPVRLCKLLSAVELTEELRKLPERRRELPGDTELTEAQWELPVRPGKLIFGEVSQL